MSDTASPPPTFTARGFARGVRLAIPFGISSIIYGLAFGLLAGQVGLSAGEAVLMSALVFSGTAQVAVLQAWSSAPVLAALFVTVIVANARYILMGAALRPWLGRLGFAKTSGTLLTLVDGSFALATREHGRGDHDAGVLLGAGVTSYAGWVVATGLGFLVGQLVANPKALGLDFVIVAFCAASAVLMWQTRPDWWPALGALGAAIAGEQLGLGAWIVVAAGITGAAIGAALHRPGNAVATP